MSSPSDLEVAASLREILGSPEFNDSSQKVWERLLAGMKILQSWLENLSPFWLGLLIFVCLFTLAAIIFKSWYFYREVPKQSHSRRDGDQRPVSTQPSPDRLAERARILAGEGQLRDAARVLQQAALLRLCLRRGVVWRPTLSDWEWLKVLNAPINVVQFTRLAQSLAFGPEPNLPLFESCERLFQTLTEDLG